MALSCANKIHKPKKKKKKKENILKGLLIAQALSLFKFMLNKGRLMVI